jgi:hypothetical protein
MFSVLVRLMSTCSLDIISRGAETGPGELGMGGAIIGHDPHAKAELPAKSAGNGVGEEIKHD